MSARAGLGGRRRVDRPGRLDQPACQVLVRGRVHRRGPRREGEGEVAGVVKPDPGPSEGNVDVPPAAGAFIRDGAVGAVDHHRNQCGGVPSHGLGTTSGGVGVEHQDPGVPGPPSRSVRRVAGLRVGVRACAGRRDLRCGIHGPAAVEPAALKCWTRFRSSKHRGCCLTSMSLRHAGHASHRSSNLMPHTFHSWLRPSTCARRSVSFLSPPRELPTSCLIPLKHQ